MSKPAVSILICTRNRCADLRETLASLAAVDIPSDLPAELIVIDNGSTDATAEVVGKSELQISTRCVVEPSQGQARARNRGLAESSGRFILFTDDDVRFPTNWIAAMCKPMLRDECDAVAGGVQIAQHLLRDWMSRRDRSWLASTERDDSSLSSELVGANFAFRRDVLTRVPGFDVNLGPGALGFGDDTMFGWQLKAAGFRIAAARHVEVEHHFDPKRLSRASFLAAAKRIGATDGYLQRTWNRFRIDNPRRQILQKLATLWILRAKKWPIRRREGIPDWEGSLLSEYHALREYIRSAETAMQTNAGELSVQWT